MKSIMIAMVAMLVAVCTVSCAVEKKVIVTVENPVDLNRPAETVELEWAEVVKQLPEALPDKITVISRADNKPIASQVLDLDGNGTPEALIFQTDMTPKSRLSYQLELARQPIKLAPALTHAMFVPARKDDIAWENDRVAFRMYGPALEATGEISSGVDIWVKNVPELVQEKWYKAEDYHTNHGQGGDFYKVGRTLGCGGTAFLSGDKLIYSNNFVTWKILADGPLRCVIELTYAPYELDGKTITETKRISMDAGSHLARFDCSFKGQPDNQPFEYVTGIVKHAGQTMQSDPAGGWLATWEKLETNNGYLGCAVVAAPQQVVMNKAIKDHYLLVVKGTGGKPQTHYAGSGWDQSPWIKSQNQWRDYSRQFALRLQHPVKVTVTQP